MAKPTTREEFITYCLRRLGFPLISIEIEDGQKSDRVDDALLKFYDYHFDGSMEQYLVVTITDQDVSNGYIAIADPIASVIKVLPGGPGGNGNNNNSGGLFNFQTQFYLNDYYGNNGISASSGISYLSSMKNYISVLSREFNPLSSFNFNRKTNRVTFNESLSSIRTNTPILVFKVLKQLGESDFPDIWNDEFLKDYATALIKKQWGENIKKYGNLTLPSGIVLNGQEIYTEAVEEVNRLETKLINGLNIPMDFLIG